MSQTTISALVEAGNASAGPPIGPQLGPLPVNVGEVVSTINQKTADFDGMEVPVDVIVDEETGEFEVEVGTPPAAALLKDRAGIESGAGDNEPVAELEMDDIIAVAEMKRPDLLAASLKAAVKEVLGSAFSLRINVDGEDGRTVQRKIENGEYDDVLEGS